MAYEFSKVPGNHFIGSLDAGLTVPTTYSLNTQGILGTSGKFFIIQHQPVVAQSNAALTLYLWMHLKTLSPTDMRAVVYNISTTSPNRRGTTANGGSSGASDWSGSASQSWVSIAMTGVTTVIGQPIVIGVYNNLASATTNYADVGRRGGTDLTAAASAYVLLGRGQQDGSGWLSTVDPLTTDSGWICPHVLKYGDGTLVGNPWPYYVNGNITGGTNYRGMRITPTKDIVVSGIYCAGSTTGAVCDYCIHKSDGTEIMRLSAPHAITYGTYSGVRFAPVTLLAGVTYDITLKPATSSSVLYHLYMGQSSPPTDVAACLPAPGAALVDGATPGSLTVYPVRQPVMGLLWDDVGAAGGGILTPHGMYGGIAA